ncbi:hypothetical protein L249_0631 [Ophiocordyceps polyrhachis-furcata BCC 54312]|uniref:Uncharacterized protein n=1 Tax=Ophiocordyceps polyrhachis-furcata BCC 54312 TaxID=1330021 RepID=A0A367LFW6_9HYPO|nr:hypothetical protein L249_0631 [Ophiocordyceps polyrhachis-furcata BCC 54312]
MTAAVKTPSCKACWSLEMDGRINLRGFYMFISPDGTPYQRNSEDLHENKPRSAVSQTMKSKSQSLTHYSTISWDDSG